MLQTEVILIYIYKIICLITYYILILAGSKRNIVNGLLLQDV